MAGTKINTTLSAGVKITEPAQNPVVVTGTGTIVTNGNYAIYDATTTPGQITNHGFLDSKSANGTGVEERAAGSTLTNSGVITGGGGGVYMIGGNAVVSNSGTIIAQSASGDGVALGNGGTITNGAAGSISAGNDGILVEAYGATIHNSGSVYGRAGNGIKIESGNGTIVNAAKGDIRGAEYGVVINADGRISNQGTVSGQGGAGVYIGGTGTLTNGAATNGAALISGGSYGVFTGGRGSAVSNFGSIDATTNSGVGVDLNHGGQLHNGSASAPGGSIHGGLDGVLVRAYGAKLSNFGTISGGDGDGVRIESSASSSETVINGGGASANALISGASYGVSIAGAGIVTNDGTLSAISGAGVYLGGSGTIANGDAGHLASAISGGRYGIYLGGAGNVTNFGSIGGTNANSGIGLKLVQGGTLVNGSAAADGAAITGGATGVLVKNEAVTLSNFGSIVGNQLYGIFVQESSGVSSITNAAGALVKGMTGISFDDAGTLTNAGTITGTGGNAVVFTSTDQTLAVDPGAVFVGQVVGNGATSTLTLAGGSAGTLAGFGSQFTGFDSVTLESGAIWTIETTVATANATKFSGLAAADTLALSGGGTLGKGETGPGTLQLAGSSAFTLAAGSGLAESLVKINAGAELTGTGTLTGAVLDNGLLLATTKAGMTVQGALSGSGTVSASSGSTISLDGGFHFAGIFDGGGTIALGSAGTITAGGQLGAASVVEEGNLLLGPGESLTNAAGQVFDLLAGSAGQTLSGAGGDSFANAGTLSATGAGSATVAVALSNTGQVLGSAGTLSLVGATANGGTISASGGMVVIGSDVSGTGSLDIGAASTLWLQAGSAAGQGVGFLSSASGALDLSAPSGFLGHISGFAGADTIDLINAAATKLTYSGGTLTVADGSATVARLVFDGSYKLGDFHLASDGHGGSAISFV